MTVGTFPFGQPIQHVVQTDRSPKRVFVLGVYASAVHARWRGARGERLADGLAVASEPYIFWRGDGTEKILSKIKVPRGAGRLEPSASDFNGPSGRSIDEDYLEPLGLTRANAWLCDLVPHSCMNERQKKAIKRSYEPRTEEFGLPPVNWPPIRSKWANDARRQEIAAELRESAAKVVITLGNSPLKWFGTAYGSEHSLGAYGRNASSYGRVRDILIEGRTLRLLPLVHPRQAAGLKPFNPTWNALHASWKKQIAPVLLTSL